MTVSSVVDRNERLKLNFSFLSVTTVSSFNRSPTRYSSLAASPQSLTITFCLPSHNMMSRRCHVAAVFRSCTCIRQKTTGQAPGRRIVCRGCRCGWNPCHPLTRPTHDEYVVLGGRAEHGFLPGALRSRRVPPFPLHVETCAWFWEVWGRVFGRFVVD